MLRVCDSYLVILQEHKYNFFYTFHPSWNTSWPASQSSILEYGVTHPWNKSVSQIKELHIPFAVKINVIRWLFKHVWRRRDWLRDNRLFWKFKCEIFSKLECWLEESEFIYDVSCLGKLYTAVINNRLNSYCEKYSTISEKQAGFRTEYSTLDNKFTLYATMIYFLLCNR